jgi:hypothetical protein
MAALLRACKRVHVDHIRGDTRAYGSSHGYPQGGGPLFGHPLGHSPVVPMMPGYDAVQHATTILSVRKGGKVVSARARPQ